MYLDHVCKNDSFCTAYGFCVHAASSALVRDCTLVRDCKVSMRNISEIRAVKWENSNAVGFGLDFKMSNLAKNFLIQHGPRACADKYGTHFIFAVVYRGTMLCTLNTETSSRQQKTQLVTDMSAKAEAMGKGGGMLCLLMLTCY